MNTAFEFSRGLVSGAFLGRLGILNEIEEEKQRKLTAHEKSFEFLKNGLLEKAGKFKKVMEATDAIGELFRIGRAGFRVSFAEHDFKDYVDLKRQVKHLQSEWRDNISVTLSQEHHGGAVVSLVPVW